MLVPYQDPIFDTGGDGHKCACAVGVMVGVSHDPPMVRDTPGPDGPHIRGEPCSVDGRVILCLGPAQNKAIIQVSGQGYRLDARMG